MENLRAFTILILGGGNMGSAIAARWVAAGHPPAHIMVVEPSTLRRAALNDLGLVTVAALEDVSVTPDLLLLAIKPQSFAEVKSGLQKRWSDVLVISIMAGVMLAEIPSTRRARVMPNLPVSLGLGMSVCCAPTLSPDDRKKVDDLFTACGEVAWLEDEKQFHAVTAISGSGPAYLFSFMEAFEAAARTLGLEANLAHQLVTQTLRGSVAMASAPQADVALLRAQVTSKGGTTEAALEFLYQPLQPLLKQAVHAAAERSLALTKSA
ncbi:MAG: pyrroline-5-carboxylate reductase [Alphaproteobacteria bacterium]